MKLSDTKIVVAVLFGLSRLLFGLLPLKVCRLLKIPIDSSSKRCQQKLQCGLAMFQAFGGGVIFATCFLHMMPEVYESTLELKKFGYIQSHYPFSQLVVSIGFFLVYFVEELAHYLVSLVPEDASCSKQVQRKPSSNQVSPEVVDVEQEDAQDEGVELPSPSPSSNEPDDVEASQAGKDNAMEVAKKAGDTGDNTEMVQVAELDELIQTPQLTHQQIIRGVLIVLALSLHGLFEGIAIGLQTSVASIWYLFVAVSVHSATILFVISFELIVAGSRVRTIVAIVLILSAVCPIGVLLGLLLTLGTDTESKAKTVALVILEGTSAGTITYITFFEVLSREKARRVYRLRRAVSILLGFCLMACLECFEIYY